MEADDEQRVWTAAPPLALAAVLLALLCAALYGTTDASEFVGPEDRAVVEDAGQPWRELSLARVRELLTHEHPVAQLTYEVNYRLGRLDVRGYRAVSCAIHVLNALLVYALGLALFRRTRSLSDEAAPWAALAGAALFAAHPLQVEAVTWVSQRTTLLGGLFGLCAALCWLRGRSVAPAQRARWMAAVIGCYLLARGSHHARLAQPLVLGLCDWLARFDPPRTRVARRSLAALALSAAAAVVAISVWNASALALYESLLVWPLPGRLSLVHEVDGSALARGGAVVLQVLLLGAALAIARRHRVAAFALFWFFGVHAVEAVFGAPPRVAERHNYFALVGPALGAGHALFAPLPRRLAAALSVLAVIALGAATHARNELWRSPDRLWDDAVAKSPRNATARLERGALLELEGRTDAALADFAEAVRLAPGSAPARERLAASLAVLHREREALPHAREAVALDPRSAVAHTALGRILASLGELDPAAAEFEQALHLSNSPDVARRLADTLVRLGRFEESLPYFQTAIARDPGDDDARTGAGAALVELGRASEALAYLEPAVESQPNPRYLVHFADALWQLGDANGALDAATLAVRVDPAWPGATSRLAWMLALAPDAGRRDPARALRVVDAALTQAGSPDPLLLDARAAALAAAGRFADARADTERAAALARDAGDATLAAAIAAHADRYARGELVRDPPRPFEASP